MLYHWHNFFTVLLKDEKILALNGACGSFDAHMTLTSTALQDVSWWLTNIDHQFRSLHPLPIALTIYSDASKLGWGAVSDTGDKTSGLWLEEEWQDSDINIMELTAAKYALFSLYNVRSEGVVSTDRPHHPPLRADSAYRHGESVHIRLMMDNTTAISYINHMGGSHSLACNALSREIWLWAISRHVWLSAAHIPGKDNVIADYYSRSADDSKEWALHPHIFTYVSKTFGLPHVDLFASRTNKKVPVYVSWLPDPGSFAVDAFSLKWDRFKLLYCFPPFSKIWMTINKIKQEKVTAILIAPLWPTQSWYPAILQLLVDLPIVFQATHNRLYLPHKPDLVHPLHPSLYLMAIKISGDTLHHTTFLHRLKTSSSHHGTHPLRTNTKECLPNGTNFRVRGNLIPFTLL